MISPAPPVIQRPGYRPYRATVISLTRLSSHFVRVRFTGPQFDVFAEHARDQRIKIVFAPDLSTYEDLGVDDEAALLRGDWYERWRALPVERRVAFRTYTVRQVDARQKLLDVDFVAHHHDGAPSGPGSDWLRNAKPGDDVIIVGPDARSDISHMGMDWHPGSATDLLLVGDETAAPAIAGIIEKLPADRRATALIEVPADDDAMAITAPAGCNVSWLARNGREFGALLELALADWVAQNTAVIAAARQPDVQRLDDIDVDREILWEPVDDRYQAGLYAWIAGESAAVKRLRRILVTELGVDRRRVAFMGYWRQGQTERIG